MEELESGLFVVDENSTDPVDVALYELVQELREESKEKENG